MKFETNKEKGNSALGIAISSGKLILLAFSYKIW